MKTLSLTLASLAMLSLTACSTLSPNPERALLSGIAAENIKPAPLSAEELAAANGTSGIDLTPPHISLAESQIRASASNPTCAQFNVNTLAFAARPETPSFGTGLMKTVIMGTIAGAASGGVASLGIGSTFIESAVVGTANQVVFQTSEPYVDKVIPDVGFTGTEKELEIKEAADRVGCPYPEWVSTLSPAEAAVLSSKLNAESLTAGAVPVTSQEKSGGFLSGLFGRGKAPTVETPTVTTPTLETPTITTPTITTPTPTPALPVFCPAGTTAQPGGTCLVTGDFGG